MIVESFIDVAESTKPLSRYQSQCLSFLADSRW